MKKISITLWSFIIALFLISCSGDDTAKNDGTTDANNTEASTAETDSTATMRNDMSDTSNQLATQSSNLTAPEFVTKAASGGLMEVTLAKMAQQKAKNQRIKSFGKMLLQDHTKANNELKGIATSKSLTVPAEMAPEHKAHVDEMGKMTGSDFEKHYMSMMVNDHQKDISDFKNASENLTDAEIKAFATKTLPVLQKHLDSAQAINQSL